MHSTNQSETQASILDYTAWETLPAYLQVTLLGLEEKQAQDVSVRHIEPLSSLGDFMVIASTQSTQQTRALAGYLEAELEDKLQWKARHIDADTQSRWIALDYGEMIIHLMVQQEREHYQLDAFWRNAQELSYTLPNT
ncbi:MAG: ribosome silencing factor [Vampirovibrionales bacterium]